MLYSTLYLKIAMNFHNILDINSTEYKYLGLAVQ